MFFTCTGRAIPRKPSSSSSRAAHTDTVSPSPSSTPPPPLTSAAKLTDRPALPPTALTASTCAPAASSQRARQPLSTPLPLKAPPSPGARGPS